MRQSDPPPSEPNAVSETPPALRRWRLQFPEPEQERAYRRERVGAYRDIFTLVAALIVAMNAAMLRLDWAELAGGELAAALTVRGVFVGGLLLAVVAAWRWPHHLTRTAPVAGVVATLATLTLTLIHGDGPGGPMGNAVQFAFIGLVFMVILPSTWGARLLLAALLVAATFWVAEATQGGAPGSRVFMSQLFVTGVLLMLLALAQREDRLRRQQFAAELQLRALAASDPLTGAANRRAFFAQAEQEMARVRRDGEALSVVMFDIDHFKRVNDRYGHRFGDHVLQAVVDRARHRLRPFDLLARTGGEEFAILLPGADHAEAAKVAERIRNGVSRMAIPHAQGPVPVSISMGVSTWRPGEGIDAALGRADDRLYAAKRAGRDRVADKEALPAESVPRPKPD